MKKISEMMNTDKAIALHQLFPEGVPMILVHIIKYADYLETNKDELRKQWGAKPQLFTFDEWLNIAVSTRRRIDHYYKKLLKSSSLFADQLFDLPVVFFVVDCTIKYADTLEADSKLKKMIEILFC
jgi:hypothetical protein